MAAVIPTYNEAENVTRLIKRLQDLRNQVSRIFVVDDGSKDGTEENILSLKRTYRNITVIQRGSKLGFGSAVRDGLKAALKDSSIQRVLQMDADLSHNPEYISSMFAVDADIVIGSRYVEGGGTEGWSFTRQISSRTACWLASLLLRLPAKDPTAGFKVYSRKATQIIVNESRENKSMGAFEIETVYLVKKHGLVTKEVPIKFVNREKGKSKAGLHEVYVVLKFILGHVLG